MKIKKEKYESLRLELQEFVPQEFVATCWYFDCFGIVSNLKFITKYKKGGGNGVHGDSYIGTLDHSDSHLITTQSNPTALQSGYIWTTYESGRYTGGGQSIKYFIDINNKIHVGSNWQQSDNPNVSG